MSVAIKQYSNEDLILLDAEIACCSASLAYSLITDEQQGIGVCSCSYEELNYLTSAKRILESTIDILQNPGQPSTATITVPLTLGAFSLTNNFLYIDGVAVYTHAGNFATLPLLLDNIVGTYGAVTVTFTYPNILNLTVPAASHYNDIPVVLSFYDNGHAKAQLQFATSFGGGEYIDSFPPTCLTDERLQNIVENVKSICGCAECATQSDAPAQANAIIINRVSIYPLVIHFTAANFVGLNYTPTGAYSLIGKTGGGATPQFDVYSDSGSGGLLVYGVGYTFNSGSGTLIFPAADNFMLQIYS